MSKTNLITMSEVADEEIKWIWNPYIPSGKVTIIQGDPGEGKTTFVLSLIALLTRGLPLPEKENTNEPINVIYQTAEDGLGDTIKPRLKACNADLDKVFVIDENEKGLTFSDKRLEESIVKTNAKIVVLDPLQAYLGENVDMHRANEIRPEMKKLSLLAERTGCAIILIGHMNKSHGTKSAYRGLGSIDFRAAARSVLIVGRSKDEPNLRIVAHCKSSLAPVGKSILFELNPETGFAWKGYTDLSVDDLLNGKSSVISKTTQAENLLKTLLENEDVLSTEILNQAKELGISEKTLKLAKQNIGVTSFKKGTKWYSTIPRG